VPIVAYGWPGLDLEDAIRHQVKVGFEDAQTIYERITDRYWSTPRYVQRFSSG
jgi:hypothetical protein